MQFCKKKILKFYMFILYVLISLSYQIQIPLKLVKTKFQKKVSNNIISSDTIHGQMNTIDNYLFAADITIGSNNQPFTVILDTGSEILWVAGEQTSSSHKYIPSNSQTSQKTTEKLNYEYSGGTINGFFYKDQIHFLLSKNFYFLFGVASATDLLDYYFDGILGLARRYPSSKYSILNAIKIEGRITSTKFSLKYDYKTNNLYLYLDEIHNDFKNSDSNLASCPLINSHFYGKNLWVCNIYSIGIKQGDQIIKKISVNIEGLFDTGTNNIAFPAKYISDFQSTLSSFNCYLFEEGNTQVGSEKAIYCRNPDNLPKITIGVKQYILTLGKENFYTKLYVNKETIYRLRVIFEEDIELCVIGQNFFYEYHTLFDDANERLQFYNDNSEKIVYHEEKGSGISVWVIILIVVGGLIIVAGIVILIIFSLKSKGKKIDNNILLEKEAMELSSINKKDMDEDTNENTFNQIMSIKSDKKYRAINININYKK